LTAQRTSRAKQIAAWGVTAIQAAIILSMRFHYVTDVVTGCLAAIAATQLAHRLGRWVDERLAPWSSRGIAGAGASVAAVAIVGEEQA
jgi:hypothetical protein